MDISSLEAFLAVAELSSFSHAAEKLFITQPAISKRIAALEDELGFPLFERLGRRNLLTEAGRRLLPRARNILLQIEESKNSLADLHHEISGTLHIATSHHLGLHRLPGILRRFTQTFPAVDLQLLFTDSETGCKLVTNGDIEMAVITLPQTALPGLTMHSIWEDPLLFMVGRDHELAAFSLPPSLEQICSYPAILPERNTVTRQRIEQPFREQNLKLRLKLETNYLETIRMLVSVGLGWTFLPQTMEGQDLLVMNLPSLQCRRELGMVVRTGQHLSRAGEAFAALLEEERMA